MDVAVKVVRLRCEWCGRLRLFGRWTPFKVRNFQMTASGLFGDREWFFGISGAMCPTCAAIKRQEIREVIAERLRKAGEAVA